MEMKRLKVKSYLKNERLTITTTKVAFTKKCYFVAERFGI